jgi:hypothetical protein
LFAGCTGFEETEISDGSDEMKLVEVTPEMRRDSERAEVLEGRDVYDGTYGSKGVGSSVSYVFSSSMLAIMSSEWKDVSSYASDGEGGARSSVSSYIENGVAPDGGEWWIVVIGMLVSSGMERAWARLVRSERLGFVDNEVSQCSIRIVRAMVVTLS